MDEPDEVDVRGLIKALAETWIDPDYAREAITLEQDALRDAAEAARQARLSIGVELCPPIGVQN